MRNSHTIRIWLQISGLATFVALIYLGSVLFPAATNARPAAEPPARLLALAHDLAGNHEVLAIVDQATGELTPLGAGIAECCTASVLDAALNAAGNKYYAIMTRSGERTPRILTFDTQSGQASASAPLTDTLAINYLAYDGASNSLLALSFITSTLTTQVVRLDPATGAATILNPAITQCCSPIAFDAAYAAAARRLYIAVSLYDGSIQPRLLTISGENGALLANTVLDDSLTVNHMVYDGANDQLWAVVYDPQSDAERLAQIDPVTAAVTPLGNGVTACCALLATDAALDASAGVVAPMIDTTDPNADDIPRFYRYALADGAILANPAVDPDYRLHYIAFEPPALQPTPTTTATPPMTLTVTPTPTVTPTRTVTPTPLPPKLFLPSIDSPE